MSGVLEAFDKFCKKDGITSEQWKGDIYPAFEAGYRSGLAKRLIKEVVEEETDARSRAEADLGNRDLDDGC